ncbi:hypothetical protein QYF36_023043 [Acer negundo]|nr:hypothetical protein QYF36_023043 [Acer negundo]
MGAGHEKFVVIGDLLGWGYSNSDIRAYLGALSILQDYYPERLGKLFIVHVPYVFMTFPTNTDFILVSSVRDSQRRARLVVYHPAGAVVISDNGNLTF